MKSVTHWILVETLNPKCPSVITLGAHRKKRVALERILRRRCDASAAMALIHKACTTRELAIRKLGQGRYAFAEPIPGPDGSTYGVWFQISNPHAALSARGRAWTFDWDVETSTVDVAVPHFSPKHCERYSRTAFLERTNFGAALHDVLQFARHPDQTNRYLQSEATLKTEPQPHRAPVCFHYRSDGGRVLVIGIGVNLDEVGKKTHTAS